MKKLPLLVFLVILLTACGGEIASSDQLTQKVQSVNAANATPTPTAKPTNTPKPEPTPKPTNTLAPTTTSKPTNTPAPPTSTPDVVGTQTAATQVAEIRQTATAIAIVNATSPAPIPTIKTSVAIKGTGLSRGEIKTLFENQYKFKFQESSQVNNQLRTIGKSPNGLALLEMIGPLTNLISVNLSITAVSDNQAANTQSVQYFIVLLQNVLPGWTESPTWLSTGLNSLLKDGQEVTTTVRNLKFSLSNVKELGLVSLIITAA